MVVNAEFWNGKRVFLTGHTGFKGAWLCLLLKRLGADVTGYALAPSDENGLFNLANVAGVLVEDHRKNILDRIELLTALRNSKPDIVIHMAAQALVSKGYEEPVETYQTNVMGTVNLLDVVRTVESVKATIVVTTDKCYENIEISRGYTEEDRLGGYDPYSNSKACAELVTSSYSNSYFDAVGSCNIASVRAGNVIGGGDWSENRIIPDCIRAYSKGELVNLRAPNSIRPWQHVLDPLNGYLILCEKIFTTKHFSGAWNFGPSSDSNLTVGNVAQAVADSWHEEEITAIEPCGYGSFHETKVLNLDSSKAASQLGFIPKWDITQTIEKTVMWYKTVHQGGCANAITIKQIEEFLA